MAHLSVQSYLAGTKAQLIRESFFNLKSNESDDKLNHNFEELLRDDKIQTTLFSLSKHSWFHDHDGE